MKKKHNTYFFKKNDDAVAGIIVALLVIGLIISVLAIIQTVFVPQWMEQKEAEHMSNVFNQLTLLKYSCDVQAISQEKNLALTTSITLGNKELPIFQSARSYGSLQLDKQERNLELKKSDDAAIFTQDIGIIRYLSKNAYFLDKTYTYEYGALITSQSDGAVIAIAPNIDVKTEGEQGSLTLINVTFNIVRTQAVGEKTSLGGYGTYPLQIRWLNTQQINYPAADGNRIKTIYIPTDFYELWNSYLTRIFTQNGLEKGDDKDYTITALTIGEEIKSLILTFINPNIVEIQLNLSTVEVQLGLGWVE
jgi:hypothetical protein